MKWMQSVFHPLFWAAVVVLAFVVIGIWPVDEELSHNNRDVPHSAQTPEPSAPIASPPPTTPASVRDVVIDEEVVADPADEAETTLAVTVVDALTREPIRLAKLWLVDNEPDWDKLNGADIHDVFENPIVLGNDGHRLADANPESWLIVQGPLYKDGEPVADPENIADQLRLSRRHVSYATPVSKITETGKIELQPLVAVPLLVNPPPTSGDTFNLRFTLLDHSGRTQICMSRKCTSEADQQSPRYIFESGYRIDIATEPPENLLFLADSALYHFALDGVGRQNWTVSPGTSLTFELPRQFLLEVLCTVGSTPTDCTVWFERMRDDGQRLPLGPVNTEDGKAQFSFGESHNGNALSSVIVRAAVGRLAAEIELGISALDRLEQLGVKDNADHVRLYLALMPQLDTAIDLSGVLPDSFEAADVSSVERAGIAVLAVMDDCSFKQLKPPSLWFDKSRVNIRWTDSSRFLVFNHSAGEIGESRDGNPINFVEHRAVSILGLSAISRALTTEATGVSTSNVVIRLLAEIDVPGCGTHWLSPIDSWKPHSELPTTEIDGQLEFTTPLNPAYRMRLHLSRSHRWKTKEISFDIVPDGDHLRVLGTPEQAVEALKAN